jgi:hypothetical protein
VKNILLGASLLLFTGWCIYRINKHVNLFNVHGIDIEVYKHSSKFWRDDRVMFYTDPEDKKHDIIQYLYNEGFIEDRRTPYTIKELS